MSPAPTITIFVRHSTDCKYKGDEFYRRCNCRKHFRWFANGNNNAAAPTHARGRRPKRTNVNWQTS